MQTLQRKFRFRVLPVKLSTLAAPLCTPHVMVAMADIGYRATASESYTAAESYAMPSPSMCHPSPGMLPCACYDGPAASPSRTG